jgi:FkbM family methyltransferase
LIKIGYFGGFRVAYRVDTTDVSVLQHSFDNDVFFPGVPEYVPSIEDVIVEVGSHIGTFSLLSSTRVKTVYSVEACLESYELLCINVALNRRENIRTEHLAISDTDGECFLYHDSGNWGHTTVKAISQVRETVPSCTLKNFLERNGIHTCQFLKLNCEGAEFPILLGSTKEVLDRFETILVLYHNDLWHENTVDDLLSHLDGFDCVIRNRSEHRGWIVAKNKRCQKKQENQ